MKLNKLFFTSAFSYVLAKADFFGDIKRAEIFEMTELKMPTFRIKLSEESYNRFQLTYKCMYDTHPLIENVNEDCYQAPWVNYTDVASTLVRRGYLDTTALTPKQKDLIEDPTLGYNDFKSIVNAGSIYTLKEIFSQSHSIVPIPSFEELNAQLDFVLDG